LAPEIRRPTWLWQELRSIHEEEGLAIDLDVPRVLERSKKMLDVRSVVLQGVILPH
jgi:hypothetical protein